MQFKLKFDEFFKLCAKLFFPHFNFRVETEHEIFELPKKLDILLIEKQMLIGYIGRKDDIMKKLSKRKNHFLH